MIKPRIGVPLGNKATSFSRHEHYAMERLYFDSLVQLGALPIALIYNEENFDDYIDMLDGILLPGGSFASPKNWYEDSGVELTAAGNWSAFLEKLTQTALERKIPVLGICAGMQFLACCAGSKMTVNVKNKLNSPLDHLNGADKEYRYHNVNVEEGTLLHNIVGESTFKVNSAHTEAVVSLGKEVKLNATAEDGCIEAIEVLNHPFALGVQWHPEFFMGEKESPDFKLMKAFVDATKHKR